MSEIEKVENELKVLEENKSIDTNSLENDYSQTVHQISPIDHAEIQKDAEVHDKAKKHFKINKKLVIGVVLIAIMLSLSIFYGREYLAKQKYKEGIKILYSDTSKDFNVAHKYFNDLSIDFSNTKAAKKSQEILTLINKYNEYRTDLEQFKKNRDFFENEEANLNKIQTYVEKSRAIYTLAYKAINYKDNGSMNELLRTWKKEQNSYYNMLFDVKDRAEKAEEDNPLLNKDDCELIMRYVLTAVYPAETIYNVAIYNYTIDDKKAEQTRECWQNYNDYEDEVTDLIKTKQGIINTFFEKMSDLEEAINESYKKLKSYNM